MATSYSLALLLPRQGVVNMILILEDESRYVSDYNGEEKAAGRFGGGWYNRVQTRAQTWRQDNCFSISYVHFLTVFSVFLPVFSFVLKASLTHEQAEPKSRIFQSVPWFLSLLIKLWYAPCWYKTQNVIKLLNCVIKSNASNVPGCCSKSRGFFKREIEWH